MSERELTVNPVDKLYNHISIKLYEPDDEKRDRVLAVAKLVRHEVDSLLDRLAKAEAALQKYVEVYDGMWHQTCNYGVIARAYFDEVNR